jgi:hypothetical protein
LNDGKEYNTRDRFMQIFCGKWRSLYLSIKINKLV